MNLDQSYDDWQRCRKRVDVPSGFSDRVMGAIKAHEAGCLRSRTGLLLATLLASRLSRIGLCSLAVATCAFRLWHVVAIFVAQ